ncbi:MAG: 4a-hydroxytetrahydrobiopterin dehydratase [Candidatus Wildermuthbacteria bacterium RIFCSPLOWO2_01_FULL_47_18]|uniref:Putative pterin-4-alpha-carbinolamine dehydratase n=2 Tax=Candidatus Wildermuthiibacteriota TaxID=1817923 RepID=A0A1G2RMA9_9BACT|nr:MAG: 4a-hydroxytetrahydrobiopterin dehydratase [Candidatus Wildermuthbacteria bacterium RIFCSPHIGHO2_02_FULL_48_16]OHA73151.1 MAG: 4a-hydroxytetrahydrobiopterin dehydratase [Candidatus Wildermuthbacteria bacterium RIFCSPLOWO2_01_FULL_47_18]
MALTDKKCVPCEGGVQPFTESQINDYLAQLKTEWEVVAFIKIKKQFKFKDFKEAMAFVNKIAEIAEKEGHHPDITINYNRVTIELSTHSIGGLSENDFILAAKIEEK